MTASENNGTHEITTEFGLRKPDGEEVWNDNVPGHTQVGDTTYLRLEKVHTDQNSRRALIRRLKAVAQEVGIDPLEYVSGHRLITRQRITITLPTIDADPTVQLGSVSDAAPWS